MSHILTSLTEGDIHDASSTILAVICSLLARFFKILLNKARIEDELDNMRRGGGGNSSIGNGARSGAAAGPAATRPAAPPAAARPGTFDTMKTK